MSRGKGKGPDATQHPACGMPACCGACPTAAVTVTLTQTDLDALATGRASILRDGILVNFD